MILELTLFQLRILYLIGTTIAIFTGFYLYKILFYIKKNKPHRFKILMGKGKFMHIGVYIKPQDVPGFMARLHGYIFNDLDTNDKKSNMKFYKTMLRIGIFLTYSYLIIYTILVLF